MKHRTLAIVSAFLVSVYIFFLFLFHFTPENILFADDQAFSQGMAERILAGETILLGLPSHLGGRHIGPFYPWFVTSIRFFSQDNYALFVQIAAAVKILSLGFLLYVLWAFSLNGRAFWVGSLVLLSVVFSGHVFSLVTTDWANNLLIATSSLLLFSFFLLMKKGWPMAIPFLFAASLSAQLHLSSLAFIAALATVAGFSLLARRSTPWTKKMVLLSSLSGVGLIAMWLPVIFYEFYYSQNLWTVIFDRSMDQGDAVGFRASRKVLNTLFVESFPFLSFFNRGLIWILFAGALATILIHKQHRLFLSGNLLGIFLMIVAVSQRPENAHVYYFYSIVPSVLLFLGLIFVGLVSHAFSSRNRIAVLSIAGTLLLSFAVSAGKAVTRVPAGDFTVRASLAHAQEISQIIIDHGFKEHNPPRVIVLDSATPARADAIHLLVAPLNFDRMAYSKTIMEFTPVLPRARQGFYLSCESHVPEGIRLEYRRLLSRWNFRNEFDLSKCATCDGCRLVELSRAAGRGED